MALGTTLGTLVEMVRDEARLSTNSSRGIDHLDYIKRVIRRHYALLAENFEWRHLVIKRDNAGKTIAAGDRYYDFPTTLDIARPFEIWTFQNSVWQKLTHGITPDDYNIWDSDDDERSDPAQKWEWYGLDQFEVWPMPATNLTNGLRFVGARLPNALVDNDATADLDDQLIALNAAATVLADNEKEGGAAERRAAAGVRFAALRAAFGDHSRFVPGSRDPNMEARGRRPQHTEFVSRSS